MKNSADDDDGWTTTPNYSPKNFVVDSSASSTGYDVGYKRPPKHSQFQKGVSGNKKGRPKPLPSAVSIVRKILKGKRRISIDGEILQVSNQEALYLSAIMRAISKGDFQATKMFHTLVSEEERVSQPYKTNEMKITLVGSDGKERPLGVQKSRKE
jgi:hypothetical protein